MPNRFSKSLTLFLTLGLLYALSARAADQRSAEPREGKPCTTGKEKGCEETVEVLVFHDEAHPHDTLILDLLALGAEIVDDSPYFSHLIAAVPWEALEEVEKLPGVLLVELPPAPPEALMEQARTVIGADAVQGGIAPAYDTGAAGVKLGLIDNGGIDHCDFSGRVMLNHPTAMTHATMVAGMMAADGASSAGYQKRGVAPEAPIYSWIWGSASNKMLSAVDDYGVVAVNNSWTSGYGPPVPYPVRARDYDKIVYDKHLNIFWAAGNFGLTTADGYYTLSHETAAKNVFTVGGIDNLGVLNPKSSRGPTQDGRLKPDAVAVAVCIDGMPNVGGSCNRTKGWWGTSFAAPAAAGGAGLLVDRFRDLNSGSNPKPALVKAILANTADDIEAPGPDYTSGYGIIDLEQAEEVIEDRAYTEGSIPQGKLHQTRLEVPAGCSEMRVMLAWSDPPAMPYANPTLVNDLDLLVTSPSLATSRPLTLNPANPSGVAFQAPNRRDNVEQVVVPSPAAGTWLVEVAGYDVDDGPQDYALTWVGEGCQIEAQSGPCANPPPQMVGWWPVDETAGPTAADIAGGHTASYVGSPTPQATGKVGGALAVNAGHYLQVSTHADFDFGAATDFSVDLWLYPNGIGSFLSKYDQATGRGFDLFLDLLVGGGGNLELGVTLGDAGGPITYRFQDCRLDVGKWQHVTVTVDRDRTDGVRCYVDGVGTTLPGDATAVGSIDTTAPLRIGTGRFAFGDFVVDEVEIFRRRLRQNEIQRIVDANENGKCPDGCHLGWDKPFCRDQQSVKVTKRIWNRSNAAHDYAYTASQVPGTGAAPGAPCGVDGPTSFTYLSPNPITVPAGSYADVDIRIDRPASFTQNLVVGCYDVALHNLDTGNTVTTRGSVQDRRNLCAVARDDIINLAVGPPATGGFQMRNTSGRDMSFAYRLEAMSMAPESGAGVLSIDGLPPGESIVGEVSMAPEEVVELEFSAEMLDADPWNVYDVLLLTDFDGDGLEEAAASTAFVWSGDELVCSYRTCDDEKRCATINEVCAEDRCRTATCAKGGGCVYQERCEK